MTSKTRRFLSALATIAFVTAAAAQGAPFKTFGRQAGQGPPPQAGGPPCHRIETNWTTAAQMPTGRSGAGVGTIDGKLYTVGGRITSDLLYSTSLESYDPIADEWTVETPLPPQAQMWAPVVEVVGGKLYALGGLPTNEESWEFDPATGQWTFRGYAGFGSTITNDTTVSGVIDGRVFVVDPYWGAWKVRAFDPVNQYTESIRPWRDADRRQGTAGEIIDRKIYVVGGMRIPRAPMGEPRDPNELVADVDVYDVDADTWTTASPMHTPRGWAESTVIDGKLYVVGGYTGDVATLDFEFVQTTEVYDPATDTWTEEPGLPTPRFGHGVGAIDGRLFVVGGHDVLMPGSVTTPVATVEVLSHDCRPGRGKGKRRGWDRRSD